MSVSTWIFLGPMLTPCHEIIASKKGMLVNLSRYLSLLSFRFTACIPRVPFVMSHNGLYPIQSLQSKYYQQYQIHLACHCITCLFSSGMYLQQGLLWMVVLCIGTYWIGKKMLLNMTFHLVWDYGSLTLHLLMWGVSHMLVLVEFILMSSLCVQVWSVPY